MNNQQLHTANIFTSDLYQFTCSYSYFLSGKHEQEATFEVFFRKYPFGGKYTIVGGIRSVKQFIANLQITNEQIGYLKKLFPHMKEEYFEWLKNNIHKNIKVRSFKEGEIVFAKQPLVSYTGPISIVQLLETPILNLIGFSSLVATNASRLAKAIQPKKCIQFGIRRAQGPDGALTASEFSYLGGFQGTSNIIAAQILDIQCYGTMSHAFVTSYSDLSEIQQFQINGVQILKRVKQIKAELKVNTNEGQLAAFTAFAKAFPNNFVTLIDTYSTVGSGLINTIIVAKALREAGIEKFGLRLDSGDLRKQSIQCRQIWNQHFPEGPRVNILASDDLHQERLVQIQQKGNQIDIFAIGTHIATCKSQPALGLVCKLVELNGKPTMKLSEDKQKSTLPSNKWIYRIWTSQDEESSFDLISLGDERIEGTIKVGTYNEQNNDLKEVEVKKAHLLNSFWDDQKPYEKLKDCKNHFMNSKKYVPKVLHLKNPQQHNVLMTQKYLQVFSRTYEKLKLAKKEVTK